MTEDSYALADLEELYIDSLWCAMAVGAEIGSFAGEVEGFSMMKDEGHPFCQ